MSKLLYPTYGYIPNDLLKQASLICDCLGYGQNHTAHHLIIETACAETGLGNIHDKTKFAGMGICQIDNCKPWFPFDDLKKRSLKHREKILEKLGIDIQLVEWEHLRYNTFLSLLFCRLHYLPFAETIPFALKERAKYWKDKYNTKAGKGSVEHYLLMVSKYYPV